LAVKTEDRKKTQKNQKSNTTLQFALGKKKKAKRGGELGQKVRFRKL